MRRLVRSPYRPNLVVAAAAAYASGPTSGDAASSVPLVADRPAIDGATTACLWRNFARERPVSTVND